MNFKQIYTNLNLLFQIKQSVNQSINQSIRTKHFKFIDLQISVALLELATSNA